jgi:hypothetical protein
MDWKSLLNNYKFQLFLFIAIRIITLGILPITNDESIYLFYAYVFNVNKSAWWSLIFTDAKQPGLTTIFGIASWLPGDPLILGRLVAVGFAVVTFIYILKSCKHLGIHLKILPYILIFSPYLLLYDRMALAESIIVASFAVCIYYLLKVKDHFDIKDTAILAVTLAFAWYIKLTIELMFVPIMLTYLYFFWIKPELRSKIITSFVSLALIFVIVIAPMLLNPQGVPEQSRVSGLQQIMSFPVSVWAHNVMNVLWFSFFYFTPVAFGAAIWGAIYSFRHKKSRMIFVWFIITLVSEIAIAGGINSHYYAYAIPFLMIMMAYGIAHIRKWRQPIVYTLMAIIVSMGLLVSFSPVGFYYLTQHIPSIDGDYLGMVSGFTSGYGVKEAIDLAQKEAEQGRIAVLIRADAGNPESAVNLYLRQNPNILVQPIASYTQIEQQKDAIKAAGIPIYFISRDVQHLDFDPHMKEIGHFTKPVGSGFVGVYKVNVE